MMMKKGATVAARSRRQSVVHHRRRRRRKGSGLSAFGAEKPERTVVVSYIFFGHVTPNMTKPRHQLGEGSSIVKLHTQGQRPAFCFLAKKRKRSACRELIVNAEEDEDPDSVLIIGEVPRPGFGDTITGEEVSHYRLPSSFAEESRRCLRTKGEGGFSGSPSVKRRLARPRFRLGSGSTRPNPESSPSASATDVWCRQHNISKYNQTRGLTKSDNRNFFSRYQGHPESDFKSI